ncbi:heme-binding protein [Chitinophaga sp. S165]|uniref:GlcG/HbpS family heme-binding protein n=1 Tax=Chitinophaga sp. S165 TaxID=2135462 RepID=UPI001E2BD008|nr:heme-binding protein [Chitinophaga sp. S165]
MIIVKYRDITTLSSEDALKSAALSVKSVAAVLLSLKNFNKEKNASAMNINSQQASAAIGLARSKANEIKVPVNIAILDTGGHLKALERMDGAPIGSLDIAIGKAKTSMLFGINSEQVGEYLKPEAGAYGITNTNGGLVGFAGGLPIRSAGEIIGFIGVSGGAVPQDFLIASQAAAL